MTAGATLVAALSCAGRAAGLLAVAWVGAGLLRGSSAAARHRVWALAVVGALLVPPLWWLLPALPFAWPSSEAQAGTSFVATAARLSGGLAGGSWWPGAGLVAWVLGTGIVGARALRGHLAARQVWREAAAAEVPLWRTTQQEAAQLLGLRRTVELRRSAAVTSPMTVGLWWGGVLLPCNAEHWSATQLRAALVHELGHVQRRDTLAQLLAQLGCALYWWNPLSWLAAARLRTEREHACDDLVLRAGILPSRYAADLLHLAREMAGGVRAGAGAACMADPSGTEARIRRILEPFHPRGPLGLRLRLGLPVGAAAVTLVLAGRAAPAATAPRSTLWVGSPYVVGTESDPGSDGTLDLALVEDEVLRHVGALEACYRRRAETAPGLGGQVVAHWVIQPDGSVLEQCVKNDTLGDDEVLACISALIAEADFPPFEGAPVDVTFPFVFTPLE